jgi:hypothetical protein
MLIGVSTKQRQFINLILADIGKDKKYFFLFSYRFNIFIFDILTNYVVHVSSYTLSLSTLYSPTLYHMYCYNLPHS